VRLARDLEPVLAGSTAMAILLGITMIYSADGDAGLWQRQAVFAFFAVLLGLSLMYVPVKAFYGASYLLYLLCVLSLILVLLVGTGGEAVRWLSFGPGDFFSVQPSEFTKLALILALAHFLGDRNLEEINRPRTFVVSLLLVLLPMLLVVEQPDLGTALCLGAALFPMLYWAGMRPLYLYLITSPLFSVVFSFEPLWQFAAPFVFAAFIIASSIAIHLRLARIWVTLSLLGVNLAAGLITVYLWEHSLRDYQKARILTFLDPTRDRLGTGWNIIQSKIAIGSGGLTGKGYLEGTQTKYDFLPAAHTDFIFSVVGEELGFIGAVVVLALFFLLVWRTLHLGAAVGNRFCSLIAVGIASMLAFHVFVNVGMTIGVMPVTGIPLPFFTYGGSALATNCLSMGLVLSIHRNRHDF
jgi:rod shape determining protein RodA